MKKMPRPGDRYRKSENQCYQVAAVAEYTETGEKLVICQALFGAYKVYAQPLERFMEEMRPEEPEDTGFSNTGADSPADGPSAGLNPLLLDFLEEEDYGRKLAIFASMRKTVTQDDLDVLFETLDIQPPPGGDIRAQADSIEACLKMQWKYNGTRLR